jgi:4-aminobutyrate aminotransferase
MVGNEFCQPDGSPDTATAQRAQQVAAKLGLLLLTCGAHGNIVRMIPALVVNAEQVDDAVQLWAQAVAEAVS